MVARNTVEYETSTTCPIYHTGTGPVGTEPAGMGLPSTELIIGPEGEVQGT